MVYFTYIIVDVDPSGRAVWGVGLQPLDCRDGRLESCWEHEWLSCVFVVCCVGSGLCDELISHSEESYQVRVSDSVCFRDLSYEAA